MTMNPPKKNKREVNGILLIDKPLGKTSNAVLQRIKWLYQAKKAGHTGSLDPLASGMLPICFGKATKLCQTLLDSDKVYETIATLGKKTTTSDAEGSIIAEKPVPDFSDQAIEQVLRAFRGEIFQIPSMFSALKHQGKPLYELARQGIEVERKPRPITIYELSWERRTKETLFLRVRCSKGTYIRNLVEDIGEALGCHAYVSYLRRLQAGPFRADQMVCVDYIESLAVEQQFEKMDSLLIDSFVETLSVGM